LKAALNLVSGRSGFLQAKGYGLAAGSPSGGFLNPYSVQGFEAAAVGVGAWVVAGVSRIKVLPAELGGEGAFKALVKVAGDSVGHRAALLKDALNG
jgi:hypothetical protein